MYAISKTVITDKVKYHGYHRYYEDFLNKYRDKKINFLEIGFWHGESAKLWLKYFKYANIYSLDSDIRFFEKYKINNDRFRYIKGDQGNLQDLDNVVKITGICDVILDDGSHLPKHQLISFNYLFENCLRDGGVYIIEDIETSYWKKGDLYKNEINEGPNSRTNIVNIFRVILPIVNREFLNEKETKKIYDTKYVSKYVLDNISSLNFGMNCIIIKKMSIYEKQKFGNRPYRFSHFL